MTTKTITPQPTSRPEREEAMGGLAKGLAIIESFGPERQVLTVSDAALVSGATPAAARRCLRTLEELGYVVYDGKFYRPTPRLSRLGATYMQSAPLPILAQPRLESVRDQIDESVSLGVLDGDAVVFVARAEAPRILTMGVRVGSRLPLLASSCGRVLAGSFSSEELDRRIRAYQPIRTTPKTVVSVSGIRDRVQHAREAGYEITDEEIEIGVRALAVPVIDGTNTICAAMVISVSSARVSRETLLSEMLPVLRKEAADLGKLL
jgi:IclR family pca regulon transcriptional regulator